MGFDSASRFRLVQEATMLPGTCLITKTEKGPFVDTGIELNKFDPIWSGVNQARIYLSVDVIRELAEGAGLFDEVRERAIPNEVAAHLRGFNEGVNSHGDLTALADRLDRVAHTLRDSARADVPLVPEGEDGDHPAVLVTDDSKRPAVKRSGRRADREHGEAAGQGDGSGGDDRSALVPERPGDGDNPFRI